MWGSNKLLTWPGQFFEVAAKIRDRQVEPCWCAVTDDLLNNPQLPGSVSTT